MSIPAKVVPGCLVVAALLAAGCEKPERSRVEPIRESSAAASPDDPPPKPPTPIEMH